jgi:hypothetical protein
MKFCLPLLFIAGPASAHIGHFGELAGHDHWIAATAIGAAIAVSGLSWWKDRKAKDQATNEKPQDEEAQDA